MSSKITYAGFKRLIDGKNVALIGVYPRGIAIKKQDYQMLFCYAKVNATKVTLTSQGFKRLDNDGDYTYYFHEPQTEYYNVVDSRIFKIIKLKGSVLVYVVADE